MEDEQLPAQSAPRGRPRLTRSSSTLARTPSSEDLNEVPATAPKLARPASAISSAGAAKKAAAAAAKVSSVCLLCLDCALITPSVRFTGC
jgi:hypothetical protein